MTPYESGVQGQYAAELTSEFATTGLFRGQIVSGALGLSPDTLALRAVGHYDNNATDFYMMAPAGSAPATREAFTLGGLAYEIKEVEALERSLAYKVVLTRSK